MVKALAVADAARVAAAGMNKEFESVDDVWRRSNVPTEALVQLAEADASRKASLRPEGFAVARHAKISMLSRKGPFAAVNPSTY